MPTVTSWHAHMPGVAIAVTDPEPVGPGRLVHLPFARWHEIDGSFPWAASKYEQARPVFFVGQEDFLRDPQRALGQTAILARRLHLALLLDDGAPMLPSPSLSMAYVSRQVRGIGEAHWADIGAFGREWIVFARPPFLVLDEDRLRSARLMYGVLADAERGGFPLGVEAGLDALERMMRPELWVDARSSVPANVFVHSMIAAEHLLLPPREEAAGGPGLTITFGRHAAVLTRPPGEDLGERAEDLSSLYRLRSRLVHGEVGGAQLRKEDRYRLWLGASLLRFILIRALDLGAQGRLAGTTLPRLLAGAWVDPTQHAALFTRVPAVTLT